MQILVPQHMNVSHENSCIQC